ncbi:MAG: NAD(P)/FAD-dependent oxidoreductase, partial [Gemmatimonadaceae bacterium]|nr:NAD(P)/FAD-dependent oxidoreductase [Gemmatimonadaceae bacterium]
YTYFNATAIGLDRANKTLATSQGDIRYDYLVVAPGIDYDYGKIGVADADLEYAVRQAYPGGFVSPTEHVTLHRKVQSFEGGVFLQTVPSGNYRCLPAPYERSCLIASLIKRNKLKGKVVILDANPDITIKTEAFHAVFDSLYKDIIEYIPSAGVTGVDPAGRTVHTEFDSYQFDEAAIYPNIRASKLIEKFGLMAPTSDTNQKEANIDIRFYNVKGDPYVYVTGDSRVHPYSKSANTSNSEAHYVARVLAARAEGREIDWESPETICYSVVNSDPMEAISVDARYVYDASKDAIAGFSPDTVVYGNPDRAKGLATLEWARGLYRDMFNA